MAVQRDIMRTQTKNVNLAMNIAFPASTLHFNVLNANPSTSNNIGDLVVLILVLEVFMATI
jgi:hypothetical protein